MAERGLRWCKAMRCRHGELDRKAHEELHAMGVTKTVIKEPVCPIREMIQICYTIL